VNIPRALIGVVALSVAAIAPLPSAYFVAVASMRHFEAPLEIAVVIAVVIEGLGFAVSHLAVEFWTHNTHSRSLAKYRMAWVEFWLCIGMYALYFVATVGLLVVLDVMPELRQTAKVLFPFLAMVGVVSIGLTFQLTELKKPQTVTVKTGKPVKQPVTVDVKFTERVADELIFETFRNNPYLSLREAGKELGISHTAVGNRLETMERRGLIKRNGNGIEVLQK
jgi:hypothetical protein